MKILNTAIFVLVFLLVLVFSCQDPESPQSDTARVESLNAQVINEGGVILTGELSRFEDVLKHGFYVASDTSDWEKNSDLVDLGRPAGNGKFEKKVVKNILSGRTFFFRAFIQTRSTLTFGKTLSFVSKGGLLPTIERVEPEKGHLDDIVKIFGERFGEDVTKLRVLFDNEQSQYYSVSENRIEVLLPYSLKRHQFDIRLIYFDGPETKISYSLATPIVEEVVPASAKIGEIISLKGNNFDRNKDKNEVFLGGKKAEIIQSTREELKVKIPDDVPSGELEIIVHAQLQEVKQEIKVKLSEPILESFPTAAKVGQELEIKGQNFHPEFYWNKVLINGIEAQITSGNPNSIKFLMPDIPYPNGEGQLSVVVAGVTVSGSQTIKLTDEWVMLSNDLPFYYYGDMGTFVINNTGYVLAGNIDFNDNKTYVFKFNPEDLSWTEISTPFVFFRGASITQTEDKLYLYSRELEDNFWEYDPSSSTWTKKAKFPGALRDRPLIFQAQGKIYIGPGVNFDNYGTDVRGFFVFDPTSNSLKELEDPTFQSRNGPKTFVFDDKVYVFDGATTTGHFPVYRFDVTSGTWSQSPSLPVARGGTTAFIYEGKGYSALGSLVDEANLMEFDPLTEKWKKAGFVGFRERIGGFSFVVNETVYVGGGSTWPEGGEREMLKWIK
jgi:hypothetical protein